MNKSLRRLAAISVGLICAHGWTGYAQSSTGIIEGRVSSSGDNKYLEKARITVEGTSIAALTNSDGDYILSPVPSGTVRIRTFYSGHDAKVDEIKVVANQTTEHDIVLSPIGRNLEPDPTGTVVEMSRFMVEESREMAAANIAINEQRFAPNLAHVVSTEEFGSPVEGNVAEFLKLLPGVNIEEIGGVNRRISIDGVPSNNTPVMLDGFNLASAIEGDNGNNASMRTVEVDMISLNNLSRIEVSFSPTPESPGEALAGTVNMIPRSSFERTRPLLKVSAYVTMQDNERSLKRTPGPQDGSTHKVLPGINLSYVVPVNKNLGFTLSLGSSTVFAYQPIGQNFWRGGSSSTNGKTFPHTTPDQAYLSRYVYRNGSDLTERHSLSVTFDYRFSRRDRISLGFHTTLNNILESNHALDFSIDQVASFGVDGSGGPFTLGANGKGKVDSVTGYKDRINRTIMPTLTWRHDGPVWKAVAGLGHSHAVNRYRDIDLGHFGNTVTRLAGVTVAFEDVSYLRPNRITVRDATGATVDPYGLGNKTVISGNTQRYDVETTQQTAYANLARNFHWRVPVSVKAGVDFRRAVRDIRQLSAVYSVSTPFAAASILSDGASQDLPPFGFPRTEYPSPELLWTYYQGNPGAFTRDEDDEYRDAVGRSKRTDELVSAAYLRGDISFFDDRLKLVGGVRAEQTNIKGEGPLTDATLNFQRDASGQVLRDNKGKPLTIVPASNALGVSQLTYLERAAHLDKEYLRIFPSINASYNIAENFIARAAYFESIGRPDNVQYSGGLTLPDTDSVPSNSNSIRVNNPGIKPWTAKSVVVRLEYYFQRVGQITIGAYRRNLTNAFAGTTFAVTPEFLSYYDLDPDLYGQFDVRTNHNLPDTIRLEGFNFSYKQALTFLPHWARGVQVFVNGSSQRVSGADADLFTDMYITPRSGNWGVALTRERFSLHANWTFQSQKRRNKSNENPPSIGPSTFRWNEDEIKLDLLGEFRVYRNYALFANLRNFTSTRGDILIYGPTTAPVSRLRQCEPHYSVWTIGVKGTF